MTYTNYSGELDLMLAVGVPVTVRTPINARPPRRWATAATWALNEILAGRASEVQVAALLTALRAKGETEDEIAGLADAMLANAVPITLEAELVA